MALKKINLLLMFCFINLLSVTSAPKVEIIGTIPCTVFQPSSYRPSFNISSQDGKCGNQHYITGLCTTAFIIIFGTILLISNIGFILHFIWMKRHKHDSIKENRVGNSDGSHKKLNKPNLSSVITNHVNVFTLADLEIATCGFLQDTQIMKDDCHIIYKGCFSDGREVAIKRFTKRGSECELSFQIELSILTEVRHDNLTSLVGYCTESDEPMLVFDRHMKNGTLYDQFYDTKFDRGSLFHTWKQRIKILLDCARGIECLHKHANRGIIHRNITSSNILLDQNWNARISDLGLAMFGPEPGSERVNVEEPVGMNGYRDPDCNSATRSITLKYDVYSFGVIMIEMLTTDGVYDNATDRTYADFIAPKIIAGELPMYLDRRPEFPTGVDARALDLIGKLSERCMRRAGILRPTMCEVVKEIENVLALYD